MATDPLVEIRDELRVLREGQERLGTRLERIESKLDTLSSDFKEARQYTNDTLDIIVERLPPVQGPKAASAR